MHSLSFLFFCWLSLTSIAVWLLPKRFQIDSITISTFIFFSLVAPWSSFFLFFESILVYSVIHYSPIKKTIFIGITILLITFIFFIYKALISSVDIATGVTNSAILLGFSYYTCRQIHVLIEVYKGNIKSLSLKQYLNYQFFLPVLIAGPIHEYPNFIRQCERRRWETASLAAGLERILYGYVKIIFIGNYILEQQSVLALTTHIDRGFLLNFLLSAKDWLYLYAQFSGFTDVALGFSLILGFHIDENFNHPLRSCNLIDFWQRWHMTLTNWCRKYVYVPVVSFTRNHLIAVIFSMLAMAFWHALSWYYLLWGCYQAAGLILCRVYQKSNDPLRLTKLPLWIKNFITWSLTWIWLISGKPLINIILHI